MEYEQKLSNARKFWKKIGFSFLITLIPFSIISYYFNTTMPFQLLIIYFGFISVSAIQNDISEPIENTISGLFKSIFKCKGYILLFSTNFFIVIILNYFESQSKGLPILFFFIFSIPLYIYIIRLGIHTVFIKQFANEEGFIYNENVKARDISEYILSGIAETGGPNDLIEGQGENSFIRVFFYSYQEATEKQSKEYHFSIFEKTFDGMFPHLLLVPKKIYRPKIKTEEKILSIGSHIDDIFSISVEKELEIEAYQILTPDVIDLILMNMTDSCFEFHKNKLYIIKPHKINTRQELKSFVSNGRNISEKFILTAKQMEGSVTAMHEMRNITE